jgi:GNAT superfamily N-acetyltransferase
VRAIVVTEIVADVERAEYDAVTLGRWRARSQVSPCHCGASIAEPRTEDSSRLGAASDSAHALRFRTMPIRIATPADAPAVRGMMDAFYIEDRLAMHPSADSALTELLADASLGVVLLDDDTAIAGYAVVTLGFSLELGGRDAFVDELYVEPAFRQQGRGSALLAAAKDWARRARARVIHLEVAQPDEAKVRFYTAAGFYPRPHPLMICWL